MSYSYQAHRAYVFTEKGQESFLKVLSFAKKAIELSGAVTGGRLLHAAGSGDSWELMACYDRLVELGYLRRVERPGYVAGQDEIYVQGREAFP